MERKFGTLKPVYGGMDAENIVVNTENSVNETTALVKEEKIDAQNNQVNINLTLPRIEATSGGANIHEVGKKIDVKVPSTDIQISGTYFTADATEYNSELVPQHTKNCTTSENRIVSNTENVTDMDTDLTVTRDEAYMPSFDNEDDFIVSATQSNSSHATTKIHSVIPGAILNEKRELEEQNVTPVKKRKG